MCRYGISGPYRKHYVCFDCRKAFKEAQGSGTSTDYRFSESPHCPICAKPMVNVGLDFKAPPTKSVEQWEVAKHLFNLGFAYHTCGCQGPGYRPTRWRDVPEFLRRDHQYSHGPRPEGESLAERFRTVGR